MREVKKGKLILADGSVYEGDFYGKRNAVGEVVFTTGGMCGYQEMLTDPTYCGQIMVLTYPIVGNAGVNNMFNQSRKAYCQGLVIGELCDYPSNWRSERSFEDFLDEQDVPTLAGIDTRAITRKIRDNGMMKGVIVSDEASEAEIAELLATPEMHDQIAQVTTKETYTVGEGKLHVAVLDLGLKKKVTNFLMGMDCHLTIFPASTSAEEILRHNPNGIVITNGPGNPADVPEVIETVKALMDKKPMLGFCMGHLVMALANGAEATKMKFGHHGNQPVKGLETGRVYISAQNHGYVVDAASLEGKDITLTHVALNDGTVEGLKYEGKNALSVQFLPDGEHAYLLKSFVDMMEGR